MIYRNITMLNDKKIGLTAFVNLYFLIEEYIKICLDFFPNIFINTVTN